MEYYNLLLNKFATLLITIIIILLISKLLSRYVIKYIKNERTQNILSTYFPLFTNVIWIIFFVYTIFEFALINPLVSLSISGVIIFLIWNNIRDFVQGTIFKFQKGNIIGQRIKIGDVSGKIIQMKNMIIEIQLENGEIVQYPYSKLSNQVISMPTNIKHYKNCNISITTPYTEEFEKLKKQIKVHLLNIPWVISVLNINLEVENQNSEKIEIKVSVSTIDEKYIPKIQQEMNSFNIIE